MPAEQPVTSKGLVTRAPDFQFPVENKELSDLGYVGTSNHEVIYANSKALVKEWLPKRDVFCLRYGSVVCATAAGLMAPPIFR